MPEKSLDTAIGKLCWLHLSDIHFWRKNDWRDDTARRKLITFLKTGFENGSLTRPNLVFCTGDIAMGETAPNELTVQYESAQVFFDQVLAVCGLPRTALFVVPGNHDVNRSVVSRNAQKGLRQASLDDIKKDWAGQTVEYRDAIKRLDEYGQFVQKYLPHQVDKHGRHCYTKVVHINGMRIGIGGFNSAWTCYDDADKGQLWLAGEWQFNAADTTFDGKTDLCIGLMHHPVSWFTAAEESLAKKRIRAGFQFWLHGHEHDAWVVPTDREIVICAGAVNAHSDDEFGINLVQLDLAAGSGSVHLFTYKTAGNAWLICPSEDAPSAVRSIKYAQITTTAGLNQADPPPVLSVVGNVGHTPAAGVVAAAHAATEPTSETPAVILPTDGERIDQTRLAILNCLKRDYFDGLPNLSFAPDGMPDALTKAFSDQSGSMQRADVADRCVYAVLQFGRAVVDSFAKLPAAAPVATLKNKHQCWKLLVNAMQYAILLGAKQNYTTNRRIHDAFNGSAPCSVEGMSWLSASVIMRENLAENLRSTPGFPVHAPDPQQDAMEDSHADDWSEIELGTGESAKVQAYKAIKYMLDRGSFPNQPTQRQIEELQGQVKLRKRDGLHLLVFNQKPDCFPPEFIGWLNNRMHVGTITILASNGEFDLPEGDWRACLAELLKVMREFEPPPIRSRTHQ